MGGEIHSLIDVAQGIELQNELLLEESTLGHARNQFLGIVVRVAYG